jgi:glycerophosphoryl diester phosphodiesterase
VNVTDAFRIIAHRGASAHAPENTLPAFRRAVETGAHEIELDVRFSADEEIIVFHDDALDAKTNRHGRVRHYDADVLKRTDIGTWFDRTHPESSERFSGTYIVGLERVFAELGNRVHYHVELKGFEDWLPLRVLQCIDAYGLREFVTVTSFSMRPLLKMRTLCAKLPICFLLRDAHDALRSAEFRPELIGADSERVQEYWIDRAADAGFTQVGVRAADVQPRTFARAADRGIEVRGWGVDDEDDLRRLLALGAVGATVDWPQRARDVVETARLPPREAP